MRRYSQPSRRALRTSLFTVVVVLAAIFILRLFLFPTGNSSDVGDMVFDSGMVAIVGRVISCEPYDGWEHRLRVWVREAQDALRMGLAFNPYEVRSLAQDFGDGRVALELAKVIVLRECLVEWYAGKVSEWDIRRFKKEHVGYFRVHTGDKCVDYSGAPRDAVPYEVSLEKTWRDADRLGLTVGLYTDWLYMYSDSRVPFYNMVEVGGVNVKDPLMADIMAHLGFDPYDGPLGVGWFRWIKMTKSSLFGEIGSYYLHDYILLEYTSAQDVISKLGPVPDVMIQRVALVGEQWWKKPVVKNFWFGLRGWAEVAVISPHPEGEYAPRKFKDLSQVLHVAMTAYSKAVADGIQNT